MDQWKAEQEWKEGNCLLSKSMRNGRQLLDMERTWEVPNLQITGRDNSSDKIIGGDVPTLKKEMLMLVQPTNGQDQKRNSPDTIQNTDGLE